MSERAFKALLASFLSLSTLWLALLAFERLAPGPALLWPQAKEARRLSMGAAGSESVFTRGTNGAWLQEKPFRFDADAAALEKLLGRIAEARLSEPLAGPERHVELGVADNEAFPFKAWLDPAAAPAVDLLVGKQGADFDSVFLRRRGSSEVFEARGLSHADIARPASFWPEKLVCELPPETVTSLELTGGGPSLKFLKKGSSWTLNGGPLSDAERARKLDPMLKSLSRLEADAVVEMPAPPALLRLSIRSAGPQGRLHELSIGPALPEGVRMLSRSGLPGIVYRVGSWRLEALDKLRVRARSPSRPGR